MATIKVTETCEFTGTVDFEQFNINQNIQKKYGEETISTVKQIFFIILEDWMYNYKKLYTANHFSSLFDRILDLVTRKKVLDFLLPGFPAKSSNDVRKVLGTKVDFGEFIALRTLMRTARKIEKIYEYGVLITILSDYHTFDQYVGVEEEVYREYHAGLKSMIAGMGGEDTFRVVSLASFPEFMDTTSRNLSTKLNDDYGPGDFASSFDQKVKEDAALLERYKQMKKFMTTDLATRLPSSSPNSRTNRKFLKNVVVGMMEQGKALDSFLQQQKMLVDYIRISIHAHHPSKGKFAVDLFNTCASTEDHILRTPWHHTVLFNTEVDAFEIGWKQDFLLAEQERRSKSVIFTVYYDDSPWLLLRIVVNETLDLELHEDDLSIDLLKQGSGMIITNTSENPDLPSSVIDKVTLTSLIKHFGLVVLKGFKHFSSERELYEQYTGNSSQGALPWKHGPVHKVKFINGEPGIVNRRGPLPMHWDVSFPPPYMGISQKQYKYEDFTPREFLLYCHKNSKTGKKGPTTFVDAVGVALSLPGHFAKKWEETELCYESRLVNHVTTSASDTNLNCNGDTSKKQLYFGGKGHTFNYPLIMACPWTKQPVLRWQEMWSLAEQPNTVQEQVYTIGKHPAEDKASSISELEEEIKKVALNERFFMKYTAEEGDQMYVNNYTTLHGRESFTNERELWRVQLIPPTQNVPEYFKKFAFKFYDAHH